GGPPPPPLGGSWPPPARPFTPADTVTGCLAGPLRFVRGSPALRRPLLVHRYVGTVGGQPATALLAWQNPDSVQGNFYLHRRGPAYTLTSGRHRPAYSVLDVFQENPAEGYVGEWRLPNRPGSQLVGTWRGGPQGRSQAVVLHESYTDAVLLSIETTCLRGGWAAGYETGYAKCYNMPTVCHDFLRLPGPLAVPPALRPLLSPPLAARRRTTRAARSSEGQVEAKLSIQLNDWNLLSYKTTYTTALFPGYGTSDYALKGSPLFDLTTGQVWPLGRLLQAGYQPALARLVARHLLRDYKFRDYEWSWAQKPASSSADDSIMYNTLWLRREIVPRPEAYVLTSEGLELTYSPCNLAENKSVHEGPTTVLVPYRELRPLMRPGAPLVRLLKARGM
ncbi:MAG: hypothetical protein ACRYFZ_11725, partial [Janthinobacterium lividum]